MYEFILGEIMLIQVLEWVRVCVPGAGFYWAYSAHSAEEALLRVLLGVIIPLTGFVAMESLFFAEASASYKKRPVHSAYQIQSGMNNAAIALTGCWRGTCLGECRLYLL